MNKVLVALDVPSAKEALDLATTLQPHVRGFKVGLELLMGEGPSIISTLAGLGSPVFVDAKLHDIPNTVGRTAERLGALGARWVTVHATGGEEMIRVAAEALNESSGGTAGILAVTVLTSLGEYELARIGIDRPLDEQVSALASAAAGSGAEGVVCAVTEARLVQALGLGLMVVTPGIRSANAAGSDQKRVATPGAAIRAGSDLLVVGRPITAAPDVVAAAIAISDEIEAAVLAT
ncbi:MAG: orotidine-5'-phosphate decarboxylase [Actinomycetota bacterium]|nr:orotidine-5'-phosphate decarboxylase [Actinomycetota bacterium]